MSRQRPEIAILISLAMAGAASAQGMAGMKAGPASKPSTAPKTGTGIGVIKAVDARAGTVTIQHGPIPAVGWPAMTMAFKARPASLLKAAKVGQKVAFGVRVSGSLSEVTSLRAH